MSKRRPVNTDVLVIEEKAGPKVLKLPPSSSSYSGGSAEPIVENDDALRLKNQVINGNKGSYRVKKLIGSGGFGAVYSVEEVDTEKRYAMKCEQKIEDRKDSKLKMEIHILKQMSAEKKNNSHFTQIYDRGRTETFCFVVMELVGSSLQRLKSEQLTKVFSKSTGLGVGLQCLEACEELHRQGYIHRDVKPANFACGRGDKIRVIYMLDFGIARKILGEDGMIKTPRINVRFKGTIRFASISCLKGKELGVKDDCESWFYLLIELIKPGGLPWRTFDERSAVLRLKEECRTSKKDNFLSFAPCKTELLNILLYFDRLQYQDKVDYEYVYKSLKQCAKVCKVDIQAPYDWEEYY